jgi:hypothetical protein
VKAPLPGRRTVAHYALALARRAGRDLRAWAALGAREPAPKRRRRRGRTVR